MAISASSGGQCGFGLVHGNVAAVLPGTVGSRMARQDRCGPRQGAGHGLPVGGRGAGRRRAPRAIRTPVTPRRCAVVSSRGGGGGGWLFWGGKSPAHGRGGRLH